jgi:hypothetical protein
MDGSDDVSTDFQPWQALKEERKCNNLFRIDPVFHARNRARVTSDKFEHGGNTAIDFNKGTVTDGDHTTGQYSYVDIPRGVIDFHTHPSACKSDAECTVGLPSPPDLVNAIKGFLNGTLAHLLYAKEGTYVLQSQSDHPFLTGLAADRRNRNAHFKRMGDIFERMHERFSNGSMPYAEHSRLYLKAMSTFGIQVHLFKGDEQPIIRLAFHCKHLKGVVKVKHVRVPDEQSA